MTETLIPAGSGIDPMSLQELLDAAVSPAHAMMKGGAQFLSPQWLADKCREKMWPTGGSQPRTVLDPQAGEGALLKGFNNWHTDTYGWEIDNRIGDISPAKLITGNCVRIEELLSVIQPDWAVSATVCNCPFGIQWKLPDGSSVESTLWSWEFVRKHSNEGYFICNQSTADRLGLEVHPWVFDKLTFEKVWPKVDVVVTVLFWRRPESERLYPAGSYTMDVNINKVREIIEEDKKRRPKFNIYITRDGVLKTYLSTFDKLKGKLSDWDIEHMTRVDECHPLSLCVDKETRDIMKNLLDCGHYSIEPAAKDAIEKALAEHKNMAVPLMPASDFETVAYADEEETLKCKMDFYHEGVPVFHAGKSYNLRTSAYQFIDSYKVLKPHYDDTTRTMFTAEHTMELTGEDRYIEVTGESYYRFRFMDRPRPTQYNELPETKLFEIFEMPEVKTIVDIMPARVAKNLKRMEDFEFFGEFQYYKGQRDFIARFACKDHGLVAGATGTGKTLMSLTLIQLKAAKRSLIIAPQGTVRDSDSEDEEEGIDYNASQWVEEIRRFAPGQAVFQLFSMKDYERILAANKGVLPCGIYITYFQAFFRNEGAMELLASESWTDEKLKVEVCKRLGVDVPLPEKPGSADENPRYWCDTVGKSVNGIRCIVSPSMSTLIGDQFDGVFVDEFHLCSNQGAIVTQGLIRLQPKYRFGFTATPIPNIVSNLFAPMGWLCVPDWYKGNRRNPAWPYALHEAKRFDDTFLCESRDLTEEDWRRKANPKYKGRCVKTSPVISSPARLLKILKPTLGYISKEQCNPKYQKGKIIEVRVDMGQDQAALYAHFLNRGNIPAKHPFHAARKQIAWLRNVCADPAGFKFGGPKVSSNFNPKTFIIMEMLHQFMMENQQCILIFSRVGQTNTIASLLRQANVPYARIDSTVHPAYHAKEANLFREKRVPFQLMGIKCAMGYSFPDCENSIIGSLEYSYGTFGQGCGRNDRVNSTKPAKIHVVLHSHSIEETQYDVVATKEDAATICLLGRRVPREFHPVEASELLAKSLEKFETIRTIKEDSLRMKWPALRDQFKTLTWKA